MRESWGMGLEWGREESIDRAGTKGKILKNAEK